MLVKDLIEKLRAFDDELPVIVKNEGLEIECSIDGVEWEFDSYCKIIIDGE